MTVLGLVLAFLAAEDGPSVRRLAVVVGANGAPEGRSELKYAHRDARRFHEVLVRVGDVAERDAELLLDPQPSQVLEAFERLSQVAQAWSGETLLFFYYSGHADDAFLYPRGQPLSIDGVRDALLRSRTTVQVGVFDACRGGAWTQAKGLEPTTPVELRKQWVLTTEGSVLFASSSGLEDAHESDRLRASFFTHHLVGGLLGAADSSQDGVITATEAFQYAQAQTVRDSAQASAEPQHPSFQLNLHGRSDLAMTKIKQDTSILSVVQAAGPLQVVELSTGLVLFELPEGPRQSRLSVSPGRYLVRHVSKEGVVTSREVAVAAGEASMVEERSLSLAGSIALEKKGLEPAPRAQESILPARTLSASLRLGVAYVTSDRPMTQPLIPLGSTRMLATGNLELSWSPASWLELNFLSFPGATVRLGEKGKREILLFGGVDRVWVSNATATGLVAVSVEPSVAVAFRYWLNMATSMLVTVRATPVVGGELSGQGYPLQLGGEGSASITHTFRNVVSVNFSIGGAGGIVSAAPSLWRIVVGSTRVGARLLPLIRVHLNAVWNVDLDVRVALPLTEGSPIAQEYLAGVTATW